MPQGLLLLLSNSALFLLRKAPNNPRQKTAAKQARIIPIVSMTTVRMWEEGKTSLSSCHSLPRSRTESYSCTSTVGPRQIPQRTCTLGVSIFFPYAWSPYPNLQVPVTLFSTYLLIVEGRIKSALESEGSLSQRRKCLNQDMKGVWALPATHQDGAERKEHAKAGRASTFEELQRV